MLKAMGQRILAVILLGLRITLLLGILVPSLACADTAVVPLRYADAQSVADAIQGMLEPDASVRLYQSQLVINASSGHLREIKRTIELLDSPPRSLLISVKQPGQLNRQRQGISLSGNGQPINNNSITRSGGTVTETQTRVVVQSRSIAAADTGFQSVRTLEGRDAFIRLGSQRPYTSQGYDRYGRPVTVTDYHDVVQGFWANARLSGDRVIITVHTRKDKPAAQGIDVQDVNTQVTGRLGQWIPIASLAGERSQTETGILSHQSSSGGRLAAVSIKVELIQ